MVQQVIHRRAAGLYTQMNPLSEVPDGALVLAENCSIDREGVLSRRRGFDRYGNILSSGASVVAEYKGVVVILDGTTLKHDSGAGVWTSWAGTFSPPDASTRMIFWEENNNLYFTTSKGIYKLDSLSGTPTPVQAGMPYGLDIELSQVATAPTWFTNNTQVAYRVIWVRKDANGNLLLGAPSQREVSINTSGATKSITLTTTLPDDVIAGDYYRIYRTQLSANQNTDPGDRCLLVIENKVTSADVTAGTISYTDTKAEAFLGEDLYTNDNQETITQENSRPPFARYEASFKGHIFLLDISIEHYLKLTFLSISGLTDDVDYVTINSVNYTFSTAEDQPTRKFQRFTAGLDAENLRNTMKSLVKIINRDATAQVYAEYISPFDGTPGQIIIRQKTLNTAAFTVQANSAGTGDNFSPDIGSAVSSANDAIRGRVARSKHGRPEAFPRLNTMDDAGRMDKSGLGLVTLTDGVLIFKADGVYLISGETDNTGGFNFVVSVRDRTLKLIAAASLVELDSEAFGFTDQGVVRVSESGWTIVSRPIYDALRPLTQFASFATLTHAVAYDSENKYILFTQEQSIDTKCQVAWVYNTITKAWTRWRKSIQAAHVLTTDGRLYAGHATDAYVLQERKGFLVTDDDFMDEKYAVTTNGVSTVELDGVDVSVVTIDVGSTGIVPTEGWLYDKSSDAAHVVSVIANGGSSYTLTLMDLLTLPATPFAASMYRPIEIDMELVREDGGNAALIHEFPLVQLYLERGSLLGGRIRFQADHQLEAVETSVIRGHPGAGWGDEEWGDSPWGSEDPAGSFIVASVVPRDHAKCTALSVGFKEPYAKERLDILQVAYDIRTITSSTERKP